MVLRTLALIGVGGTLFLGSSEAVRSDPGAAAAVNPPSGSAMTALAHQNSFLQAHPEAAFVLTPEAEMEGTKNERIIRQALDEVPHRKER